MWQQTRRYLGLLGMLAVVSSCDNGPRSEVLVRQPVSTSWLRAYAGESGELTAPSGEASQAGAPRRSVDPFDHVRILPGTSARGGIKIEFGEAWLHELEATAAPDVPLTFSCEASR